MARTRCSMPRVSFAHSRAEMMRGTMSKGIRRSSASACAVDVEGDAGAAEERLGLGRFLAQVARSSFENQP
jgi:hypothetical protein